MLPPVHRQVHVPFSRHIVPMKIGLYMRRRTSSPCTTLRGVLPALTTRPTQSAHCARENSFLPEIQWLKHWMMRFRGTEPGTPKTPQTKVVEKSTNYAQIIINCAKNTSGLKPRTSIHKNARPKKRC